jgi:phospholipid transport system substrate-binding protein
MLNWTLKIPLALALALSLLAPAARADAADPATPAVQSFYATLLECMKGGKTLGAQGRYDKLKPVIERTFDLATMVKYAVGPAWSTTSAEEQKALTDAFTRMTVAQYAGNFSSFDGEKFTVEPKAELRGTDHYVKTALVAKDQTVAFIYRMRQFGSDWRIIDILLDGSISSFRSTARTSPPRSRPVALPRS